MNIRYDSRQDSEKNGCTREKMTIILAIYSYFHKERIVGDMKAKRASREESEGGEEYDGSHD